jgi:hypothetical protein
VRGDKQKSRRSQVHLDSVINVPPSLGVIPRGLFIGVVRTIGKHCPDNPLTAPVSLSVQSHGCYRHFTSRKHFMLDLLGLDMCPPL